MNILISLVALSVAFAVGVNATEPPPDSGAAKLPELPPVNGRGNKRGGPGDKKHVVPKPKRSGGECKVSVTMNDIHQNMGRGMTTAALKAYPRGTQCFFLQTVVNCLNKPIVVGDYCVTDAGSVHKIYCDKAFPIRAGEGCGESEEDPFDE